MSTVKQRLSSAQDDVAPQKRERRGRPKLLTREQIVDAAADMLDEAGLAAFTMNKLAQRLGASVMTLYTYFPSREALLEATAERIFNIFEVPDESLPWREAIEAWLRGLQTLFNRFPVGLMLIKWDGTITPSWMRVWLPLLHILERAGLSGQGLVIASNWVGRVSMALLMAKIAARDDLAAAQTLVERDTTMADADRAMMTGLTTDRSWNHSEILYEFGITNILDGLGRLIAEQGAPAR